MREMEKKLYIKQAINSLRGSPVLSTSIYPYLLALVGHFANCESSDTIRKTRNW